MSRREKERTAASKGESSVVGRGKGEPPDKRIWNKHVIGLHSKKKGK
ncbi:hypothetical protein N0O92_18275 [Alkalihalobacillus sp. MEB130]|nr:hypothetical protein [Alkalihalobacillus sp. MEB130]MDT8862160.1 hypothetical protein [Alkalihalobacillus sp. MEB130]